MGLRQSIAALLGISAYAEPDTDLPSLGDAAIDRAREAYGGQLQIPPQTRTRWYLKSLEAAEYMADLGFMAAPAQLMRSARRDGVYYGVLSTLTDGLVRLPKRWRGDAEMVSELELGGDEAHSVFDEMAPATELSLLAADGAEIGVGVGELLPVVGRDHPLFVRLNPEFLVYRWNENRWYFRSLAGLLPITPGDGRWVLHIPGGRATPWQHGMWKAIGRAYIRKEHAALHRDNWESTLAHPARIAVAPQGSDEKIRQSWLSKMLAWGKNTVFALTPGYDVRILESNGRGADSFRLTIEEQNYEMKMAVAGQVVTSDGGTGVEGDIFSTIRADRIKATADALATTINTQIIPPWVVTRFGEDRLRKRAIVEWDVAPPQDRLAETSVLIGIANAIIQLTTALGPVKAQPDVMALCARFGVPVSTALAAADALANDNDGRPLARLVNKKPAALRLVREAA